jgi:hypothetical protein
VSKKIKIEIEIPAPPEGWGEVEWRNAMPGDYWFDCGIWSMSQMGTLAKYPVARKLVPPWMPPPELVAVFGAGWLTRDKDGKYELHTRERAPSPIGSHWVSDGLEFAIDFVVPSLLPPLTIPWEKCCFKIGDPQE